MQIAIAKIFSSKRLDAEFYTENFTNKKGSVPLSKIADIKVGKTPKIRSKQSVPFYRVENIKKFLLQNPNIFVSKNSKNKSYLAKKGDILFSVKGRVGDACIVENEGYFNQDIVRITPHSVNRYLLLAILNSKYINNQVKKLSTGQMHPYLRVSDLKKIKIPILNKKEANTIINLVDKILKSQNKTSKLQNKIEKNFCLPKENKNKHINTHKIFKSHRLDAEFFLSPYTQRDTKIKDLKNLSIRVGEYKNKFQKFGTSYIRAKDIKDNKVHISTFIKENINKVTSKNEILLSRVGSTKSILINDEKYVPSDNFLRIKYQDNNFSQQALVSFFNSFAGKEEISRHTQGSKQKRINKKSLLQVRIPYFNSKKSKDINLKINKIKTHRKIREELINELNKIMTF